MSAKRTIDLRPLYPDVLKFGPWWYRWFLLLTTRGRAHHTGLGEPCVRYHYPRDLE